MREFNMLKDFISQIPQNSKIVILNVPLKSVKFWISESDKSILKAKLFDFSFKLSIKRVANHASG